MTLSSEVAPLQPPNVDAAKPILQRRHLRRIRKEEPDRTVVDDLPRPMPIGRAELDVLETFLGTVLDDLLRRGSR